MQHYPGYFAQQAPERPAVVNTATGQTVTYGELDADSSRIARAMAELGLQKGDRFSLMMENHVDFFKFGWAAFRAGFYITAINRFLTAPEASYIVENSQSKVLVASANLESSAQLVAACESFCPHRFSWGGEVAGCDPFEPVVAAQPGDTLPPDGPRGDAMLYSSGSTGRPKGVRRPLTEATIAEGMITTQGMMMFGFTQDANYLSPAPIYHAAPFMYATGVHTLGGCVYLMEKFDPEDSLRCIQEYSITHSQWVPTMFLRMLKLPEEVRSRYDLSSHQLAIHAAAPCPVDAKRAMIDWWGPILFEYYAGTEGNGTTIITSEQWLEHPGSVGTSLLAPIHICDEEGNELPAGEPGTIYFERPEESPGFEYHNDPGKTQDSVHPKHPTWTTLGDVGYLDEDNFLYLTDRKAYMIISGGVNIYPQEIEDALVMHPKVADAAVFGVPNEDFGEEVKAVVQMEAGVPEGEAAQELEQELMAYCRERLAAFKVPRSVDFVAELPRLPTGKLYKRILRDKYWGKTDTTIV